MQGASKWQENVLLVVKVQWQETTFHMLRIEQKDVFYRIYVQSVSLLKTEQHVKSRSLHLNYVQ